jgi:3-oxoadipate enol-lactonase
MTLLAHQSAGQGDPVLLLNGGMMTMAMWEPIAGVLQQTYRVIRCDFRGQLLSPGPPPTSIAVLDALGVARAHVVGTSFGGFVGLTLAASCPSRVQSLVAGTTTAYISDDEWRAALPLLDACRDAAAGSGDGGRIVDLIAPSTYSPAFLDANALLLAQRRALVSALPRAYFEGAAGIVALLDHLDLRPLLPAIECPTLVLAAGADRTFPLPHARALAAAIAGARLEVVDRAAHGMFMEEPARVAPLIAAFLASAAAAPGRRGGT